MYYNKRRNTWDKGKNILKREKRKAIEKIKSYKINSPKAAGCGRKKGGKNRPKEEILQEKALRKSEDFASSSKKWRTELAQALEEEGKKRKQNPMERVAEAFYEDEKAMVKVLKHLLPQLKAIELKGLEEAPFKLILQLGNEAAGDKDKNEDEDV